MRVGQVRVGEKFVLDDRGGVWEMIEDEDRSIVAKCVFGPRSVLWSQISIPHRAYCYVIFEEQSQDQVSDQAMNQVSDHSLNQVSDQPAAESQVQPQVQPQVSSPVESVPGKEGMRIRIIDEISDTMIREIVNPTIHEIAAMSAIETLRLIPAGKKKVRAYHVSDTVYDMSTNMFYIIVSPERERDDEDEDTDGNGR
jgi:hypothetical protein